MPEETLKVTICMGSSCFARGNNLLINKIKELIGKYNLQDRVELSATLCQNCCREGPNIRLNGTQYSGMNEARLEQAVKDFFRINRK